MSYPINYPTPQGANVQIFNASDPSATTSATKDWIKPQGASFVWFTLIGGGGNGNGTTGGGSGAVTNFMCPAFLIPDMLRVIVGTTGLGTQIRYQQKDGNGYQLLVAASGSGSTAGSSMSANAFTAMGFFQSVAGQAGNSGAISASSTTFLSGGSNGTTVANYGYSQDNGSGIFQMQPIIVGLGGAFNGKGGIGCGGGSGSPSNGAVGGPGLVVIITW